MSGAIRTLRDDRGDPVRIPSPVARVVSLVPSLTESIAASADGLLVGATRWCTHPPDLDVARVGGTKNPDVAAVLDLRPDLVVANDEENRREDVAALRAAGVAVWVTAPRTVPAALASLRRLVVAALALAEPRWWAAAADAWAGPPDPPRWQALVPIWRRPWMALGSDTFAGDLLARCGAVNVLAGDPQRYPRIDLAEVLTPGRRPRPDLVVLPDEPYAFHADDGPESFPRLPCALVPGRHLTWYGPSLVDARRVVRAALEAPLDPRGLPHLE